MLTYLVNEPEGFLNNSFIVNMGAAYRSHLRDDTLWEATPVSPMEGVDILVEWRNVDTFDKN